jgi:hypothetical protein
MLRKLVLVLMALFLSMGVAIAEQDYQSGGVDIGTASKTNFSTGMTATRSGTVVTVVSNGTQTITGGTINGATIGATTPASAKVTSLTLTGAFIGSTENVATSSANPGVGVASLNTLITCVTTDETGTSADVLTLADGTAGQVKIINLKSSLETAGLKVTPTNILGATSDVLLSATGDSVTFTFNGTAWTIQSTNGTRQ